MDDAGSNHSLASSSEKQQAEDLQGTKTSQCSVTTVYKAYIAGGARIVTVVWSKTLISHSLSVVIDLKPWRPFWSKKGLKSLELENHRVDVYWDLRSARFSSRPEPAGGYYVALVCDEVVALLLGDSKKEAFKRTKARPSLADATLISRRENVFGRRSFSTRARFGDLKREHEIVVENSISGMAEPEMWISIDGDVVVHVDNLRWKFRGNETVAVERTPVQIFWDVHGWLFGAAVGLGHAVFIFKPSPPETTEASGEDDRQPAAAVVSSSMAPEFCFVLNAWKLE
ncbi:unnamed protein product [Spirodela intermedia]|uniref:Uncharacterized protein n=1 Tax=Spirodela intermedia TaxID=51605 RepID=A0A7I8JQK0_SPIIN|nr:unnamed protein product [Spirodela intermedia]CAA6672420.1 unnamed protein product [Spirodela intermedia]